MITPADLQHLFETWEPPLKPDGVPEISFRLWISAHTLVNRRIPIEQGAYLHAEANLYGQQYTWNDMCSEYEKTLAALRTIQEQDTMLQHLWRALRGWDCYDPTPEAHRYNKHHKIDRYRKATLMEHLVRTFARR